ncbi:sulfotransferase family protein [Nocardiopsis endophytica]|uniref:sulfotransferase family protein n=1 Tax=Nocardiopsis endophytica TaxID=3018445 RepID=UPI0038CD15F8
MRLPLAGRSVPTPLKNAALTAADAAGRVGRRSRALPDFLIVGAQRCGTTTLYKALMQHPQVFGPTLRKGVHFFDTAYGRGTDWYRSRFPLRRTVRAAAGGAGGVVGESSPYYLFHPLCAERIAADLPEAKVVVMLRDPVERAHSAHSHESARGYETEPFERALDLEAERIAGEEERLAAAGPSERSFHHQHHAYVARGRYIDQLLRLERHVGRERMFVVDAERFFADPDRHFPELEEFLGVRHCPGVVFGHHNARPRAELPERLRRRLEEAFADSDERLAEWWGRTPSWREPEGGRGSRAQGRSEGKADSEEAADGASDATHGHGSGDGSSNGSSGEGTGDSGTSSSPKYASERH